LTEITGVANTVTFETAVLDDTQPAPLDPVTENEAFEVGDTVADPLENVYELAPDGTITNCDPEQIVPLLTETIGSVFTTTDETAVFDETQPCALVPTTLYEVLVVGATTNEPPATV
jgi:hypothetical protein